MVHCVSSSEPDSLENNQWGKKTKEKIIDNSGKILSHFLIFYFFYFTPTQEVQKIINSLWVYVIFGDIWDHLK